MSLNKLEDSDGKTHEISITMSPLLSPKNTPSQKLKSPILHNRSVSTGAHKTARKRLQKNKYSESMGVIDLYNNENASINQSTLKTVSDILSKPTDASNNELTIPPILPPTKHKPSASNSPQVSELQNTRNIPDLNNAIIQNRIVSNFSALRAPDYGSRGLSVEYKNSPYTSSPNTELNFIRRLNGENEDDMEKKLNDLRQKFDKRHRLNSQLGLTNLGRLDIRSAVDTDNEHDITDRRQELGFRRANFWQCCGNCVIDKRSAQFFVHVLTGISVMIFCMAKIWNARPQNCDGDDVTVYFSLLSALVGFYMPSPSINRTHKEQ